VSRCGGARSSEAAHNERPLRAPQGARRERSIHIMRNGLAHAGRQYKAARQERRLLSDKLGPKMPKLAKLMNEAEADVHASMTFQAANRTMPQ
jgi:hypothetical protein